MTPPEPHELELAAHELRASAASFARAADRPRNAAASAQCRASSASLANVAAWLEAQADATTWLSPRLAIGVARDGVRGWFLLGANRPADGSATPMVAWGRCDRAGLIIEHGAVGPAEQALLDAAVGELRDAWAK